MLLFLFKWRKWRASTVISPLKDDWLLNECRSFRCQPTLECCRALVPGCRRHGPTVAHCFLPVSMHLLQLLRGNHLICTMGMGLYSQSLSFDYLFAFSGHKLWTCRGSQALHCMDCTVSVFDFWGSLHFWRVCSGTGFDSNVGTDCRWGAGAFLSVKFLQDCMIINYSSIKHLKGPLETIILI